MKSSRYGFTKERPIASLVISSGTCNHVEYRQKRPRDAIYLVSLIYICNGENDRWDMRSIVFRCQVLSVSSILPALNDPD